MLFTSLDFYAVTHQLCPPLLRDVNQRALSAEEITEACELLLAAARQHGCCDWLLDGRSNPSEQPPELHQWMREEYFPRVRAALGQPLHVAFLVAPAIRQGLERRGLSSVEELHPGVDAIGWFADDALAWLARQRHTGPQRESRKE